MKKIFVACKIERGKWGYGGAAAKEKTQETSPLRFSVLIRILMRHLRMFRPRF